MYEKVENHQKLKSSYNSEQNKTHPTQSSHILIDNRPESVRLSKLQESINSDSGTKSTFRKGENSSSQMNSSNVVQMRGGAVNAQTGTGTNVRWNRNVHYDASNIGGQSFGVGQQLLFIEAQSSYTDDKVLTVANSPHGGGHIFQGTHIWVNIAGSTTHFCVLFNCLELD